MEENPVCRLCLSTSVVFYSLLQNNGREMLTSLTRISVEKDTQQSMDCCVKCWYDLKSAYRIQQKFIEAEKKLQDTTDTTDIPDIMDDFPMNICPDVTIEELPPLAIIKTEIEDDNENNLEDNAEDVVSDDGNQTKEVAPVALTQTENDDTVDHTDKKKSSCFICGLKCDNQATLYTHTNKHYEEEQECNGCSIKLANIATYRKHLESHHPSLATKTYCCTFCALTFKHFSFYKLHLSSFHTGQTAANKELIRKDPPKKAARKKSEFGISLPDRKECPICKARITISNLRKHINNHKSEPAVCHLCGSTAKNPESLRGHMYYVHSDKRLTCETCGKVFKRLYGYKLHIKKVHTEDRGFTCDSCGKQFHTNYQLNIHIRIKHLKERRHICQYCKRGFSTRFAMRTHERQHTNETPYVCEVCGEGFRQNVSLRAHRRSRHNIEEDKTAECSKCHKMFRDDWALNVHIRSVHD